MKTYFALLSPCARNPPVTGGFPSQRDVYCGPLMFLCCLSELNVEQTVDWPVIRDDMTDIAVMYEFVCICASITKWSIVISKLFSTNVTKMLPINPQKGKLQDEKHTSLSCEKSSNYEGSHNAGTLHSAWQCAVLQFITFPRTCRRLSARLW